MKLKYYGTAAAEGIPALFCDCGLCRYAKEHGGKDIRTRSQAMVDDQLLIDFPADTFMHTICGGLDLNRVRSCIVTHNHSDHLYAADLEMRREGFAHPGEAGPLTFYCSPKTSADVEHIIRRYQLDSQNRVLLKIIEPYQPYLIEGYTVTALEANHDPECDPYIYLISDGHRGLLYAHDTGMFPPNAWTYLERVKPVLDFVSLDCTGMNLPGWVNGHMSLDTALEAKKRLTAIPCAHENTKWCVHHFSHNGGLTHAQLEQAAGACGFLTSFDGMTIEF